MLRKFVNHFILDFDYLVSEYKSSNSSIKIIKTFLEFIFASFKFINKYICIRILSSQYQHLQSALDINSKTLISFIHLISNTTYNSENATFDAIPSIPKFTKCASNYNNKQVGVLYKSKTIAHPICNCIDLVDGDRTRRWLQQGDKRNHHQINHSNLSESISDSRLSRHVIPASNPSPLRNGHHLSQQHALTLRQSLLANTQQLPVSNHHSTYSPTNSNFYSLSPNKSDLTLYKVTAIQTSLEDNKSQTYLEARNPLGKISPSNLSSRSPSKNRNSNSSNNGNNNKNNNDNNNNCNNNNNNNSQFDGEVLLNGLHINGNRQHLHPHDPHRLQYLQGKLSQLKSITRNRDSISVYEQSEYELTENEEEELELNNLDKLRHKRWVWGWIILVSTWVLFIWGVGSMFGIWKAAYYYYCFKVNNSQGSFTYPSAVRYSLSYEKETGYPISEYYPCLFFMIFIVSWVWCITSWMGLKFYRHTKGGISMKDE